MHRHYIINHDLGLRICVVTDTPEIDVVAVLNDMITQKLADGLKCL